MKLSHTRAVPLMLAAAGLSGCLTAPRRPTVEDLPPSTAPLSALPVPQAVPDAKPRSEPRSRYGNPPFYDVFGKRYYVLSSSVGYVERGVASWYGPGFHKVKTSTGEMYDMYGMTAAHKTLPLPAYVQVTNLQNGRTVIVRVNDRGPFVGNRIIDLSYTAASRLDMLRNGTAMVEVRAIDSSAARDPLAPVLAAAPAAAVTGQGGTVLAAGSVATAGVATPGVATPGVATPGTAMPASTTINLASASGVSAGATPTTPPGVAPPITAAASPVGPGSAAAGTTPMATAAATATPATARPLLFVQAAAFADPANAQRLATRLRGGNYGNIFVRDDVIAGRKMFRVRIGPVSGVPEFDRIVAALERAGVHDAHLALD